MDTGRLSQGQMIAGIAGVVLLVSSFLPWYGFDVGGAAVPGGITVPGAPEVKDSFNLWDGSTLDIYLAITALVAILPAALALTGSAEEFSFASAATFLLGAVGTLLVIAFLTVDFPDEGSRKIGAFLGLVAAAAIAFGGFRAMQDELAEY
jgi:hypothetical protein